MVCVKLAVNEELFAVTSLVAMAVNDSLTSLGFSVIGPFSRVSDASRALRDSQIDAATLDVNLDGEMVYSLAEILIARNIPFVFATGYRAESSEKRFEHLQVQIRTLMVIFINGRELFYFANFWILLKGPLARPAGGSVAARVGIGWRNDRLNQALGPS